ncbi:MAG: ATP-dependent DNA helicase [Burkholderiales bacterium RIFCSPHIGHO2_12_FULL_61_11]|nr:MAG: ATP-dependent DNA helicase [Burkholderiales bacterium RIFCSPHIGHO2_12_FULL_61_11]
METTAPSRIDPFESLNAPQRLAVEHGLGGCCDDARPLLIIAGAGSGKTNTLAYRVANLIMNQADPQRILLLTFSRRAAMEMQRRVGSVLNRVLGQSTARQLPSLPWSGTFHSIGARLLRDYAGRIGLDESFTIHDRSDSEDLLGLVRHDLGLSSTRNRFPQKGTCLSIYSRAVNSQQPLVQVLQQIFPWCAQWESELKKLFGAYVEAKQEQNVLDYDDLLLFWSEMMADPELGSEVGARFDHVLVDEYQDTNRLQASIVLGLKPTGQGVTVVGDDAQSIYSFRGATVRNILDFPHQFSQPARLVTLERNYRSTQPILDVSNAVIAQATERHAKNLWTDKAGSSRPQLVMVPDEAEQARWVANRILEHREAGLTLKSQAVLFRASSHSAALELELTRRQIPFVKFGGLKFLEAAHVKDMLAILRFAQNPRGRMAGFRVVQLIPGIGPAHATRLLDAMDVAADPTATLESFQMPASAATQWQAFVQVYRALRHSERAWPADMDLAKRWYGPHLERLHDDAPARRADVDNLERIASGYASRERFLSELTLDPPDATSDQSGAPHRDEDYVILSTIHSAKGQEWTSVHVLNVVDGCIPSDLSTGSQVEIEEERRLLYVAMTRAKEHLQLLVPHRFYVTQQSALGDRHLYASRTRFISDALATKFETLVWPSATAEGTGAQPAGSASIQVRERARSAWR